MKNIIRFILIFEVFLISCKDSNKINDHTNNHLNHEKSNQNFRIEKDTLNSHMYPVTDSIKALIRDNDTFFIFNNSKVINEISQNEEIEFFTIPYEISRGELGLKNDLKANFIIPVDELNSETDNENFLALDHKGNYGCINDVTSFDVLSDLALIRFEKVWVHNPYLHFEIQYYDYKDSLNLAILQNTLNLARSNNKKLNIALQNEPKIEIVNNKIFKIHNSILFEIE